MKTSRAKWGHRKSDTDLRIAAPFLLNSSHMRRVLTLLLLAVFGLPTVAPLLAMGQGIDAHVPACCRRIGAHHCMRNMGEQSKAPAFSARCPEFPQPAMTAPAGTFIALAAPSLSVLTNISTFTATQRAETQYRISRERSHHKRGPPVVLL
ncbi:MAG TPA: hypothetical protein VGG18_07665 [Granulicella sp.]